MPLQYTVISGDWSDGTGAAVSGIVTFCPSQIIYAENIPLVTPSVPIVGQVIGGQLRSPSGGTLQLLATDNAGLEIVGGSSFWFWSATVRISTVAGASTDTWDFPLPYSAEPVDLYATKNLVPASWPNPMASLGDIISAGAGGSPERIAGNATTAREFLASQGTGTTAQAPAWGALQAGDIPSLPYAPSASPAFTGTPTGPTASPLADSTQLATTAYADLAVGVEKSRALTAEGLLAPLASPAMTGTPTAPTASALADSTQVATTAYTDAAVGVETSRAEAAETLKAPLASPALTGSPTAPTQTPGDNSTKVATTAFTTAAVAAETSRATTAEALLAPKASPALTGTPTAPTATALTNSTQVSTTAYADAAVGVETSRAETAEALKAPLASPALTGNPTAPTQSAANNSTRLATTAYADNAAGTAQSAAEAASDPLGSATAAAAYYLRVFAV